MIHIPTNRSQSSPCPGIFQLREINQMERGMRQYLEWELHIDPATLKGFDRTFLFFFFHLVSPSQPLPPLFCCYFPGVKHRSSSFDREFLFFFHSMSPSATILRRFQLIRTAVSTSTQPRLASWLISWVDQLCTANQVEVTK